MKAQGRRIKIYESVFPLNLHQNIAKSTIEFAYLQKKLEVHEELQTNWVLCDILDFEEELLSPNAQSARVAYRSGKTDFERAIGNAELKWEQFWSYFETDLNSEYLRSEYAKTMIKRIPFRRTGELEELSGPLLMLCSNAGSYVSGTVISVDGAHAVNPF